MESPETIRGVARWYAEHGLRVFPVVPDTKRPAILDWPNVASSDVGQVDEWWSNGHVGHNIGIVCGPGSDLLVPDVDDYKPGATGVFDAWCDEHGSCPDTPLSLTASGGRQFFLRWPEGCDPRQDAIGPGVDLQGKGRFVVAPPSTFNGKPYTWEESSRPSQVPFAEVPAGWREAFGPAPASSEGGGVRDPRFAEILTAAGWIPGRIDGDGGQHWTRSGKNPREGTSGTVYAFPDSHFTTYSPNALGLETHRPYQPNELAEALGVGEPKTEAEEEVPTRPTVTTLGELLASKDQEYDWLVPGLLERMDRAIVTGAWGYGKSTLLRQMGLGAALGVNTLTTSLVDRVHPPCSVLLVDLENSKRQLRREFRKVIRAVDPERVDQLAKRFFVESHAEGLVLDLQKDRDGDRAWLEEVVATVRPDLLLIGPLYKMLDGDPNDEIPGRNLAKWLDRLRGRYDLTLLLEAHGTHKEPRPSGWSGWRRWPEFGFALYEDGRLEHWRGQREERSWPDRLVRGGSHEWLWKPGSGTTTEVPLDPHETLITVCKVEVIRHLHKSGKPLTGNELVELIGRRRSSVLAAIAQLRQDGMLVGETVQRRRSDGRTIEVEAFSIAPGMDAS